VPLENGAHEIVGKEAEDRLSVAAIEQPGEYLVFVGYRRVRDLDPNDRLVSGRLLVEV